MTKSIQNVKTILLNQDIHTNLGLISFELSHYLIFPNPAKEWIEIRGDGFDQIRIIDFSGKLVYEAENEGTNYSISSLSCGLYFIQILEQGTIRDTKKLVIAN